ncbi:MAG: DNA repair protein RecN, partial [Bdellovibrionales bacterium]|nr:DNA repair protein RecN [Bdellovibrionales bacterium]
NVVTGETGAGKSIFLKALELIAGRRASSELVRTGEASAEVEALFEVDERLRASLADADAELADVEQLVIRRVIDENGRGKVYVNGRLSTVQFLQQAAPALIDITGQHQQTLLLESSRHRELLDAFGVPSDVLSTVGERYRTYRDAAGTLQEFLERSEARTLYFERLRQEATELGAANLRDGSERARIEQELERLKNVEALVAAASNAAEVIEGEDRGVAPSIHQALEALNDAAELDPELVEPRDLVESALVQLQEAALQLGDYASSVEVDPERLEAVRARLAELARLERKYGRQLPELIGYLAGIEGELNELDAGAFDVEKLRKRAEEARVQLSEAEELLTRARRDAARKLEVLVERELRKLNMKRARFQVSIEPGQSSARGCDVINFMLSANPGEPLRELSKVASGGELSRILLVLKTSLNERSGAVVQVFDEIDTGIGGAVAHVVGEKLSHIARFGQVVLVTHAPQIAAFADKHFVVSKSSTKTSTSTVVRALGENERVKEIARMLAGKKVTKEFETSAQELIASCGKAA